MEYTDRFSDFFFFFFSLSPLKCGCFEKHKWIGKSEAVALCWFGGELLHPHFKHDLKSDQKVGALDGWAGLQFALIGPSYCGGEGAELVDICSNPLLRLWALSREWNDKIVDIL